MNYKAIQFREMSGDGVHEKVIDVAMPYLDDAHILIAGAGEGSLEYKLLHKGIHPKNIQAVDHKPDQYKLEMVNVQYCDLNAELPFEPLTFDVCFATEVIEHLYNPHNLINETWRVLRPGGILILSSPNVQSITQKIRFLFSDKLAWFHEEDYLGSGHIHPVFDWLLERMVRDKFELIKYTSQAFHFRIFPFFPAIPVPFKHRLFAVNNIFAFKKLD